ncbi:MAG: DUF4832 domain-containing protein [Clostridium sp.]|uniref:DUF4832 domain-containing protein n=1 Tax=Clostridium sp. TaxID=1506 RepID=UPI0029146CDE|nr:DUF4832 domain-containing protein [Clostridium sp.]MDU5109944.1 DUF4832 domain-containing protein [Clostridium sp.]
MKKRISRGIAFGITTSIMLSNHIVAAEMNYSLKSNKLDITNSTSYVDWEGIEPISNYKNMLNTIKAIQKDNQLYVYLKSSEDINGNTIVYVDSDNDSKTGTSISTWNDSKGIDYKIEENKLYKFNSDNNSWIDTSNAKIAINDTVTEVAVSLEDMGVEEGKKIKVGASKDGEYYLPDAGTRLLSVDPEMSNFAEQILINEDGYANWADTKPLYEDENGLGKMYSAIQNGKLHIKVVGELAEWNDIFINVDGNKDTGCALDYNWADMGADFLLENGELFKSTGTGWMWDSIKTIEYRAGEENSQKFIEMYLNIKDLGDVKDIKIGFNGGNLSLPAIGTETNKTLVSIPEVNIDGEKEEWGLIPSIAVGENRLKSIKSIRKDDKLDILIEASELGEVNGIFLDSDNTANTGCLLWPWANNGCDYFIENGKIYKSIGSGWSWSQEPVAECKWVRNGTDIEVSVDLSLLENVSPNLKLSAYIETPETYLPNIGEDLVRPLSKEGIKIEIDGSDSDWNSITQGIDKGDVEYKLSAAIDANKLYVRIDGSGLNSNNNIYISDDNIDNGAEYKIERNSLYKNNNGEWNRIKSINVDLYSDRVVYEVNLKDIELFNIDKINLAARINDTISIPNKDLGFSEVKTIINRELKENTFYPIENMDVLHNPYMGFASWAETGDTGYEQNLVYVNMSWNEIEPEKGIYNWEAIEKKYNFDYWRSRDVKFVMRIYLEEPRANRDGEEDYEDLDIPAWLYDEIDGDGTWYYKEEIGGGGFSPNYSNPIIIENHKKLIESFGERYNNDQSIAYLKLGSLGHWGEWHTWPSGSGEFPKEDISNQYVQHYIDNLSNKMLGMRKPYDIAEENKLGLFNDMFGDKGGTEEWVDWINNGRYDEINDKNMKPVPDFWKYAFSGGEFSHGNARTALEDDRVTSTINLARISHTTFMGPCSPLDIGEDKVNENGDKVKIPAEQGSPIMENVDMFHKTIGYRYILESITTNKEVKAGEKLDINMVWNNKGIAPFYFEWPLEIALADENGAIAYRYNTEADIKEWLPGLNEVNTQIDIPNNLEAGSYTILASINNPETQNPEINLAIEGKRDDGRYELNSIKVNKEAKEDLVKVTGITLDREEISLNVGEEVKLNAAVKPENATNKEIFWRSDDNEVATIENGVVKAIGDGETLITVATKEGYYKATCKVKVNESLVESDLPNTGVGGVNLFTIGTGLTALGYIMYRKRKNI